MIIISNQVYRVFLSAKGDLLKCSVPGGEKNSWVIVDRGGGESVPNLTLCIRRKELLISHVFKTNKITFENIFSLGKRFYLI